MDCLTAFLANCTIITVGNVSVNDQNLKENYNIVCNYDSADLQSVLCHNLGLQF